MLIRLHGWAGWSAPLSFANREDSFFRIVAHFFQKANIEGTDQTAHNMVVVHMQQNEGFQYTTVNILKFLTLVACQKSIDKKCRPRSDCF